MTPSTCERQGSLTFSAMGRASMSARQATARPGRPPLQHPQHPVAGDAGGYRQAQIPEICRHRLPGALLLVRELRVLMKLPAPGHELRFQTLGPGFDFF